MNAFSKLDRHSLEALAGALETGRVTGGNPLTLRQYLPAEFCAEIGNEIEAFIGDGMSTGHVSRLIRAVLVEREASTSHRPSIELVWTGPEGTVSSSRDTGVVVRELFMNAKKTILIAGFAIHRGREIFKELAERMTEQPSLEVTMFLNIPRALRDTTLSEHLVTRFARDFKLNQWPGTRYPVVYFDPRTLSLDQKRRTSLHAKCVIVDAQVALVTSANFTEAAQVRNIEAGVLVRDEQFALALKSQFDALVEQKAVERVYSI